jgi:hypothetical protein
VAQETITLRLVAQDLMSGNVSKAIGGLDKLAQRGGLVGSVMQGVGQSFGQMLNPVALVTQGIGMLTDTLGESLAAYREDLLSQQQMRASLEANVKGWDGNTEAIERTIAARMELGFSDDEQRESLSLLVAQIGNVNDALAIQRTAMDLARLKGTSLAEAQTILAKAYNGSAAGLQRMGIKLEKGAKGMAAIAAVQGRVAGQAETWAESSTGSAKVLELRMGELQESIGRLIEGPAVAFTSFLSGVVDIIDGPSGASANIRDLSGEIRGLRASTDAIVRASPFEALAADIQAWNEQLLNVEFIGGKQATDWVKALGADTLRLFGKASAETLADVVALAQGVQDAGGNFGEFAAIVRRKVAPGFNVLTGAWTGTMASIEDTTTTTLTRTARNVRGIAWNISTGIVGSLRDGIPDVKSVMKDLRWAIEHPMMLTKNRAKILGALTGDRMVEGITSKNPAIRQAAIDARTALLTQWNALPAKAMVLGKRTMAELMRGLNEGERYAMGVYGSIGNDGGVSVDGNGFGSYRLPTNGSSTGSGGGAGVTVNVTHIGSLSEADGENLARTVTPHIQRQLARGGR